MWIPTLYNATDENRKKFIISQNRAMIIWDPEKIFTVTESVIQHKHKITPYLNETLYGVTEQTYLSGIQVFDNGNFLHLNKGQIILNK